MTFRRIAPLLILPVVLIVAGCTAPAGSGSGSTDTGSTDTGSTDTGSTDTGSTDAAPASGEACPTIAGYEYFSDSMITKFPEAGAPFGDGSLIEFTGPSTVIPLYSLYYVTEDGEVLQNSGGIFDQEQPDGVYSTDALVFGDEANNRPGILELETVYEDGLVLDTPDPSYVAGTSTVVIGRYCLTLKVNP